MDMSPVKYPDFKDAEIQAAKDQALITTVSSPNRKKTYIITRQR